MLRTIFTRGLFALLGMFALRLAFGVFGTLLGLFIWLAILAVKIAVVGLVIYLVIALLSPDTARRMRERWGNGS